MRIEPAGICLSLAVAFVSALMPKAAAQSLTAPTPTYTATLSLADSNNPPFYSQLSVDGAGNAYVTSVPLDETAPFLTKLSAQGLQSWSVNLPASFAGYYPVSVAADTAGNVYTAGDAQLLKFNTSGTVVLTQSLPNPGGLTMGAAFDPATKHLYVLQNFNGPIGRAVVGVVEYDTSTLNEVNSSVVDNTEGSPGWDDWPLKISVDPTGDVYVSGYQTTEGLFTDGFGIKWTPHLASYTEQQNLGQNLLTSVYDSAMDFSGNIYTVGSWDYNLAGMLKNGAYLVALGSFAGDNTQNWFDSVAAGSTGNIYTTLNYPSTQPPNNVYMNLQMYYPTTAALGPNVPAWTTTLPLMFYFGQTPVYLDSQNNIYVVGWGYNSATGAEPPVVQKFGTATAQPLLSISSGDAQIGVVGSSVTTPLTVLVQTTSSAPVSGAMVSFAISTVPAGATGYSLSNATAATSNGGVAATVFTLGSVPADYYIACGCPTCVASANSVSFHACGKLNVPDFSQGNPQWGNDVYGITVSSTIHALGCGLSSLADVNNFYTAVSTAVPTTNPGVLNTYLISLGTAGYQGGTAVNWPGIQRYTQNHIRYIQAGSGDVNANNSEAALLATADSDLSQGKPVIFHVVHPTSHFVVATGKCGGNYLISDPGSQTHYEFDPNDPTFTFVGIRRFSAR